MVRVREAPEIRLPFTQVAFKPQLELLGYLRENGFKTYIVTGGGVDFVRLISEQAYGIPREQVIGSSVKLRVEMKDGRPVLMKTAELGSFDDREVKVQNIGLQIGRGPLLARQPDGDLGCALREVGLGARLALLLHHDDVEREAAYDREFMVSPLAEALDKAAENGIRSSHEAGLEVSVSLDPSERAYGESDEVPAIGTSPRRQKPKSLGSVEARGGRSHGRRPRRGWSGVLSISP